MSSSTEKDKETWPLSLHKNDRMVKYGTKGAYRDMLGYGPSGVSVKWPKGAKVALNFVINYEEGGEQCILHGDNVPERYINLESIYDYGPRAGFWRLHRLFTKRKTPVTVFAVGMALERNPAVCHALRDQKDWEVASHGYRDMDYQNVDIDLQREHMQRSILIHEQLLGKRPVGIFLGKPNEHSRRLVVEEGGFKYDSDSYADDLPYWNMDFEGKLHLVVPNTVTETDVRFTTFNGYPNSEAFLKDLKETFRYLLEEGRAGHCKMMTVALHCRLARPGRVAAIAEFLDHIRGYGREVWVCTREQIADFWMEHHFPRGAGSPMKSANQPQQFGELFMGFKRPNSKTKKQDESSYSQPGGDDDDDDEDYDDDEEEEEEQGKGIGGGGSVEENGDGDII